MKFDHVQICELLDLYDDTTVSFGEGAVTDFENLIIRLAPSKIVAFTGKRSVEKNGAWARISDAAGIRGASVLRYSDIEPEPALATVKKMLEFLKAEKPDELIAIGGGSVMDAAKAAYISYQAGGAVEDYFGVNKYSDRSKGVALKRVICFPTTAGTGSEATPYSNIVDRDADVKKLIMDNAVIPEYSFVVPSFCSSMDDETTRATACDALAHLIEGFLNISKDSAHPAANKWAVCGIKLIAEALPAILADRGNSKARAMLSAASCMGGMVIRFKPTSLPHLCSFSWFDRIPHGIAVAVLLPYAWDYYSAETAVQKRTMELAGIFGSDEKTPGDVIRSYLAFLKKIAAPVSLKETALDRALLAKTASSAALNRMKLESAPRPVPLESSEKILSGILDNAWNGRILGQ